MKKTLDINDILNSKVNLDDYVENFEDYNTVNALCNRIKFSGKAKSYIHSLIPNDEYLYFIKDYKDGYYHKVCAFRVTKKNCAYCYADVENIDGKRKVYGNFDLKYPTRNNYTKIIDEGWRKEETIYECIDYVTFTVYDGWITPDEQEKAKELYMSYKNLYTKQQKEESKKESKRIENYNLKRERDEYEKLKQEFEEQ